MLWNQKWAIEFPCEPSFSDRISGIPILGCPVGTLDAFLANVKCNESGMHAGNLRRRINEKNCQENCYKMRTTKIAKLTLQTPQATVHSSLVADAWFAWHSIHKSMMWFRQMAQLSTTISKKNGTETKVNINNDSQKYQISKKSIRSVGLSELRLGVIATFNEIAMTHKNWNKATVHWTKNKYTYPKPIMQRHSTVK